MKIKDFKIGQEVVIVVEERLNERKAHIEVVVSVGRKYVRTARADEIKKMYPEPPIWTTEYYIRDENDPCLTENKDWGHPKSLYPSEKAYREREELRSLREWLLNEFKYSSSDYTLEQLREVKRILEG